MRLSPYPAYRPSGEAWLPEMPDTWDLAALRWLSQRYSGGTPDKANSAFWDDGDIPWLNSGAVNDGYITAPSEYITREGFLGSSAKWIPKGALVVALAGQGKTKGMVAQLGMDTTCNQSMAAIIPTRRLQARYLYWWLTANYFNIRNMAGGEARDGLNLELLGSIPCPVPSDDEQRFISTLLDRETAKIDTLVAKKRTLIERLKEKRTALISRTVTRGLPPDAARAAGLDPHPKLRPSGIEWLGEVPEHWVVSPLKFLVSTPITDGPHETPQIFEEGVPFVSAEAISGGRINFESIRGHISDEDHKRYSRKYKPRRGDIYMVKSGATTGRVAMVETDADFNIWSPLAAIRCNPSLVDRRFVYLYLQSREFQAAVELSWSFGTQQNIGMGVIQNLHVPVPSLIEQVAIADLLSSETAMVDAMVVKVVTAIERLQEYRTALITAAVTGKIDVRNNHE